MDTEHYLVTRTNDALWPAQTIESLSTKVRVCHNHGDLEVLHTLEPLTLGEAMFVQKHFDEIYQAVLRRN